MSTETRRTLRPQQRALTWGDHWILPVGDVPSPTFIKVGHVLTRAEVGVRAQRRRLDVTGHIDNVEALQLRGFLDCLVYHRANSTGVYETHHRSAVWPIRPELFTALKRAGYDPRNLNPRRHEEYARAYADWFAMVNGTPPPQRPFAEFLSEAEQLVQVATAHNSGQTYFGYNRIGDRRIVMQMSSWPRANEAILMLEKHGFRADHTGTNHVDCWDRSESDNRNVSRGEQVPQ